VTYIAGHGGLSIVFWVEILFATRDLDEEGLLRKLPALNGAIMETMRLYPIAVAQLRTATRISCSKAIRFMKTR